MIKKLRKALSDKCKDMGLSDKAIDRLAELGGEGLEDDATDEAIAEKVDLLVPYASAMQAEITRKTRKSQSPKKQSEVEGNREGEPQKEEMPEWAKNFQSKLDALEKENADLKAEKIRSQRQSEIAARAKELGIPEYLVKRLAIADDADIDTELGNLKQEMVNDSLMPKGQAGEVGTTVEAMKADAKAWANGLPSRQS